jgi:hypothetical protein
MKYSSLLSPNLYFLLMLKITPDKFLLQNLQIEKLEGTSGNLRGSSGTLEPDKCGDACARGGAMRLCSRATPTRAKRSHRALLAHKTNKGKAVEI